MCTKKFALIIPPLNLEKNNSLQLYEKYSKNQFKKVTVIRPVSSIIL